MVSGSSVQNDNASLSNVLNSYSNHVNSLSSSWIGPSYENLSKKAVDFLNEATSLISNQMSAYGAACDLMKSYSDCKKNLVIATNNYNAAVANRRNADARSFANDISTINSQITTLRNQIGNYLAQAANGQLVASSLKGNGSNAGSSSYTAGAPLDLEPGVHLLTFTTADGKEIQYNVIIPEDATEGLPIIMYLNGDGHTGQAKSLGFAEMAERAKAIYGDNAPFIMVQPVSNTSWSQSGSTDGLNELIQQVVQDVHANPNKVIVTGASGGGIGSWNVVNDNPSLYSAFVPVSGDGRNIDLQNFVNIPIRAITSGDWQTDGWNMGKMEQAVNWINENGGNATYETRPGNSHHTIIKGAYTEDLFEWMIAQ